MLTKRDEAARCSLALGEYRDYLDDYLEGRVADPVVACQVALYLGRADEAADWLAECERGPERDVLEAEWHIGRGDYDAARGLLVARRSLADRLGLARICFLRGEWLDCLGWARLALAEAEATENLFMEGRARHLIGTALYELGDVAEGGEELQRATLRLRGTENGRFRRFTEVSWAWTMMDSAREPEGLALMAKAHDESLKIGHAADVRIFRAALTQADYAAARYEHALTLANATLADARHDGDHIAERYALDCMTRCCLALGRIEDARDAMDSLALLDEIVRDADLPMSEALEWRVAGREGNREATDELLARAAELPGWRGAVARVWAWDALSETDPVAADERRGELLAGAEGHESHYVRAELRAVSDAQRAFRITKAGEVVLNPGVRYLLAAEVAPLLDRYLYRRAYGETGGGAPEMARKLGLHRTTVTRQMPRYGLAARPPGRQASAKQLAEPERKAVKD